MSSKREVKIGIDPHKLSVTIEVLNGAEVVLGQGRYATDKAGYAAVRAATDIPIAAGESEFTRFDFRELAERAAVDVFQPDLAICGGITEAMRIAAIASAYNLRLAPHLWSGAPAFAAGMHVAAAASPGSARRYRD